MTRGSERLAALLLAAGGLLFSLMLVEVGVRMLHLVPDRFWEPDPLLGVRLVPDSHGWWTQEDREFVVPVQINSQGRRDVTRNYDKAADTFRILVLGDSFVEALQVPLDAAFPRVLERQLANDGIGKRIEILAAGVSGHGTASEVLFFERDGQRYHPDLVVLAFYPGNDVKNNSATLEDRFAPVYGSDGSLERVDGQARGERRGWSSFLPRSEAYVFGRQMLLLRHPDLAATLLRFGLVQPDVVRQAPQRDGIPVDYGVYAVPVDAEWEEAWRHTEDLLGRARRAVVASGAQFVIVVLSTRDQVYPTSWEQVLTANPPMRGRQWDLEAPQRRLMAWCAQHDVPCIALGPTFRDAASRGGEPLHYPREGHWTAAGHQLAAIAIKDFLQRQHLLPAGEKGVTHEVH